MQEEQAYNGSLQKMHTGDAVPQAENFGDLITADHKVLSQKIVNLETNTDMQSWCRTWPLNGSKHIRAKQKLLTRLLTDRKQMELLREQRAE